eukprot:COSAG06_NODE_20281_length_802_cov_0.581792_1_plen_137_part_01
MSGNGRKRQKRTETAEQRKAREDRERKVERDAEKRRAAKAAAKAAREAEQARLTALLERLPMLPTLLWLLAIQMVGVAVGWHWLGLALRWMLYLGVFSVFNVGVQLSMHQVERQLRRPPMFGDWATRHFLSICCTLV